MARTLDEDELIEHWLLIGKEPDLLTGRTGPSKLALVLWLKFFAQHGRFPEGRSELPDEAVAFVAGQVKVPAAELGLFASSTCSTSSTATASPCASTTAPSPPWTSPPATRAPESCCPP
ncbi:DUF4158 domain-containing protein [Microtetraspora malaysiensis]|uniref:DUF4158 domain-containing protein n=1 Tax=Microtetraspora malaysiensis TaxID=161358 RepID=UPI003D90ECC3